MHGMSYFPDFVMVVGCIGGWCVEVIQLEVGSWHTCSLSAAFRLLYICISLDEV